MNTYIKVRTQFEGIHFYPNAGKIDPRIKFLENNHRHIFKVEVKISVTHLDRELEFFLVKWALEEFIDYGNQNHKSCEMIATDILENHLIPTYGERYYEIVVSEDGENDGIVEYIPRVENA
jgi:6-pyruvoyl-tetrahydropterin synthase